MILIGIKGRLHSGKDTAFEYLRDTFGGDLCVVRRGSFADKMKVSGTRALGYFTDDVSDAVQFANFIKDKCSVCVIDNEGNVVVDITGREYWQYYGTEAHRHVFADEFWVDALLSKLPEASDSMRAIMANHVLRERFPDTDVLVVTDVRFPNEAERIIALGGEVWQIDADDRLGPLADDAHISEHPLPPELVTLTVANNGDLTDFYAELSSAFMTFGSER